MKYKLVWIKLDGSHDYRLYKSKKELLYVSKILISRSDVTFVFYYPLGTVIESSEDVTYLKPSSL